MLNISEMRWELLQAIKHQDWETYEHMKGMLDAIDPPGPPPRYFVPRNRSVQVGNQALIKSTIEYFDPPCRKCGSRITCETCLADLQEMQ